MKTFEKWISDYNKLNKLNIVKFLEEKEKEIISFLFTVTIINEESTAIDIRTSQTGKT